MSPKTTDQQMPSLEELVINHSYEMLALITVLEKKGLLTRQELIEVIKELQSAGTT